MSNRDVSLNSWLNTHDRAELTSKSWVKSLLLLFFELGLYSTVISLILVSDNTFTTTALALFAGLVIGFIHIIAHDCVHGAYFPSKAANALVGRFLLAFQIHTYTLWDINHNKSHHAFTNLKGKDRIWTPLSIEEFSNLNMVQKALYRIYRHPLGFGAYYFKLWITMFFIPTDYETKNRGKVTDFIKDAAFVIAFCSAQIWGIFALADFLDSSKTNNQILLYAFLIPFLSWNYVMGFTVYFHHTHPNVKWYNKKQDWSYHQAQISTVRVVNPEPYGFFSANINEHTAHHCSTAIPIYNLGKAHSLLEKKHGDIITTVHNSFTNALRISRLCKLYDYENMRWLDFNGNPTTPSLRPQADEAAARAPLAQPSAA